MQRLALELDGVESGLEALAGVFRDGDNAHADAAVVLARGGGRGDLVDGQVAERADEVQDHLVDFFIIIPVGVQLARNLGHIARNLGL